ncbi:helix-turn-helix domain-containing protein [Paenibacillus sp. GCM10027626]|uniref:helix-turn-helix domain-containing protein n=1 Tax=Paenibacillus sp. GCM10027626 TaxID=3273411 RepID=UPI00362A0ABF
MSYKRLVAIIQPGEVPELKERLHGTINEIHVRFKVNMMVAIGKPVGSMREIGESYRDAGRLLEERLGLDRRAIVSYDDPEAGYPRQFYYPLDLERDLMNRLMMGKEEEAKALLETILEANLQGQLPDRDAVGQFLVAIVSTINRLLQALKMTAAEVFGEGTSLYNDLKGCESEEQLTAQISAYFSRLLACVRQKNSEQDHSIADQMIAYIHTHYDKDLSLTDMSSRFNLSSGYVSQLFKSYIGENFKDYLNIYRVRKAKEMMQVQTDLRIQDVALRVGCNHPNTFIRIFKKYEGVSPGQYMKEKALQSAIRRDIGDFDDQ